MLAASNFQDGREKTFMWTKESLLPTDGIICSFPYDTSRQKFQCYPKQNLLSVYSVRITVCPNFHCSEIPLNVSFIFSEFPFFISFDFWSCRSSKLPFYRITIQPSFYFSELPFVIIVMLIRVAVMHFNLIIYGDHSWHTRTVERNQIRGQMVMRKNKNYAKWYVIRENRSWEK